MKTIKRIVILVCFVIFAISINNFVNADSNLELKSLNYDVQINSDGSMDVVEIWNIDITETNTLYKTFKIDSTKYSSITDGKVSRITNGIEEYEDVNIYSYHLPEGEYYFLDRGSNYEVAWGTGYEDSSGNETYVISYHVNDAVGLYNDCAEIYWQFIGENFEIPAEKITGTIKLPKDVENTDELKVWGHTPDLNGTISIIDNSTVEFEVNDNLPEKMVEVRIAIPRDIIETSNRVYNVDRLDSILNEESEWAEEANSSRVRTLIIIGIIFVVIFIILIYYAIKNIKILVKVKKIVPTVHYDYYRELPRDEVTPAEATYILQGNYQGFSQYDIGRVFSATLLDLFLKKLIKLEETGNKKEDCKIILLKEDISKEKIGLDEHVVYNFIRDACKKRNKKNEELDNQNEITTKELKKYINSNTSEVLNLKNALDRIIKKRLLDNKYLDLAKLKKKNANMAGCSLSIIIFYIVIFLLDRMEYIINILEEIGILGFIIGGIAILIIADMILSILGDKRLNAYTQLGVDEQDKWKAFKKYMEDFSLLKEKDVPDIVVWEKYLVYATAFGISEKVLDELKTVYPDFDTLDYNIYPTIFIMSHINFASSFKSVSNAMSTSFSSASGGGGGFSGGGGRRRGPAEAVEEGKTSSFYFDFRAQN